MIRNATLLEYYRDTYRVQRTLRASSEYHHQHSLDIFIEWFGSDPPISQIDDSIVSEFVASMAKKYKPRTVKKFRMNLLCTLRHAAKTGQAQMPIQPRNVKVPPQMPEAWTLAETRNLLKACTRVRHGMYLEGCIRLIWDTGLRYEDARKFDMTNIDSQGQGIVYQNKTTEPIQIKLRPKTIEVLNQLGGRFPLDYGQKRQSYVWWGKLCKAAEVPHGGPQRIRRSAATELERTTPGTATAFLGHKSADLAMKHYLDPRILNKNRPRPTDL